jgi:hypothetical protein
VERNKAAKTAVKALLRDKDFYGPQVSLIEQRKLDFFAPKKDGADVLPKDSPPLPFENAGVTPGD